jgi:hypothetical protein
VKKVILILIALFILGFVGCSSRFAKPGQENRIYLPKDAEILEDWGNGWIVFESNGRKFLYRRAKDDMESITELRD